MSVVRKVRIAAAASLVNGLQDVINAFQASDDNYENIEFEVAYGSSGLIANELIANAGSVYVNNGTVVPVPPSSGELVPIDIFLSASQEAMNVVTDPLQGIPLIVGTPNPNFIANTLVIVKNNKLTAGNGITHFVDVSSATVPSSPAPGKHIWIAEPYGLYDVPAGRRAEEAFTFVGRWAFVDSKTSGDGTRGTDVQDTLAKTIADLLPTIGVVYHSDAVNPPATGGAATIIANDANPIVNNKILYQAAQILHPSQDAAVVPFVLYLTSYTARGIFLGKGFRDPSIPVTYKSTNAMSVQGAKK